MRENHYAISCIKSKISQVSNYKMSITLLIYSKMSWTDYAYPTAKLAIFLNALLFSASNLQEILEKESNQI